VLGDIPSLRENWQSCAIFVTPGDERGLLRAIEQLTGDEALRSSLAEAARLRARAFTAERMARSYLELYRELVARRSAGASAPPRAARSWEDGGGMAVQPY
jgi:glycosyltransferase involved in cell wall biosynthesis